MSDSRARAALAVFDASDGSEAMVERLLDDGAVVARGVVPAATIDAFNAEIEPLLEADDPAAREYSNATIKAFYAGDTRHVAGLAGKSRVFRDEILCHPLLVDICERLLRPNCAAYRLNFADVMDRGPRTDTQMMHRDDGVWPYLPRQDFPLEFAAMIALGKFTAEMGATRVVPGSHLWPPERAPEEHEIVAIDLRPGDAIFYLGSTLHSAGANRTGERRRGMHLSYCLGWLRTQDNNYLTVPLELARALPPEQQAMLGFAIHDGIEVNGGYLGAVDWRDPMELIAEGRL